MPTVDFSTPVRLKEMAAAATVEPASAVRKLSEQEGDALGYDVVDSKTGQAYFRTSFMFLNLTPGQTVTVTLSKNLRDIYGNALGEDKIFQITNSGYCPATDFRAGLACWKVI